MKVSKIINGYNLIAISLIIFGSVILVDNIPPSQWGKFTGIVSPFTGVIMLVLKYLQTAIKSGKERIENIEKNDISILEKLKIMDSQLYEINTTINRNATHIAINAAKLEVFGKYGLLEERIRENERKIQTLELYSLNEPE